jgi:hypothetical protein
MKVVLINLRKKYYSEDFFELHKQEMFSAISRSSRGGHYQYIEDSFGLFTEHYLSKSISAIHRKIITRIRLSSHNQYIY